MVSMLQLLMSHCALSLMFSALTCSDGMLSLTAVFRAASAFWMSSRSTVPAVTSVKIMQ